MRVRAAAREGGGHMGGSRRAPAFMCTDFAACANHARRTRCISTVSEMTRARGCQPSLRSKRARGFRHFREISLRSIGCRLVGCAYLLHFCVLGYSVYRCVVVRVMTMFARFAHVNKRLIEISKGIQKRKTSGALPLQYLWFHFRLLAAAGPQET